MSIPKITTQPVPVKELNRYFWIDNGVLMQADMYADGSMKKNSSAQVIGPTLGEISILNNRLGLHMIVADFPWVKR